MSLISIGSAVFELLSRRHTDIHTDRYISYYFRVRIGQSSTLDILH